MKHTIIAVRIPKSSNPTPASLLLKYARENANAGYLYGRHGKVYLRLEDKYYEYDHWDIKHLVRNEDTVTIYLNEIEKGAIE